MEFPLSTLHHQFILDSTKLKHNTLFLGKVRPPVRLTSTKCLYFPQVLTTAFLESVGGGSGTEWGRGGRQGVMTVDKVS